MKTCLAKVGQVEVEVQSEEGDEALMVSLRLDQRAALFGSP